MSDPDFPCALSISVPLPTHRLASAALRSLRVDAELSPLVRRSFSLRSEELLHEENTTMGSDAPNSPATDGDPESLKQHGQASTKWNVLRIEYKASTHRMLRVAVNGFMESLGVVLGVMEELDVDVLAKKAS